MQRNDRFDLLDWLDEESEDASRTDIEEQAETLRNAVGDANGPGRFIALALVVLGALLMAVVHLPRPADMLRWPGITLVMGRRRLPVGRVCTEFRHTGTVQGRDSARPHLTPATCLSLR